MIPHDDGAAGLGTGLRLVLGSASPGRAEVLTRARVPFRVVVSGVDEAAVGAAAPSTFSGNRWRACTGRRRSGTKRCSAALHEPSGVCTPPASATPMMVETPQPLWQHSSACRISLVLPTHSKE